MKKVLSLVLALLMVVSMMAVIASAADPAPAPTNPEKYAELLKNASVYSGTPDYSWYVDIAKTKAATAALAADATPALVKVASADKTYTIKTADQFWGFMEISNGMAVIDGVTYPAYNTFKGETIKLDADVVINVGDADAWWKATEYSSANGVDTMTKVEGLHMWTPISQSHAMLKVDNADPADGDQYYHKNIKTSCFFEGTFDGQGHAISGIYSLRGRQNGLFGQVTNGHVKNFKLVNSVFYNYGNKHSNNNATPGIEKNNQGASQGAGLVERLDGAGTVSGIYTDAYFRGGWCTGGIVAYLQGTNTVVEDCVFDGVVDGSTGKSGFSCGLIIGGDDNENQHYVKNCVASGTLILGRDLMSWQTNPDTSATAKGCGLVIGNLKKTAISDVTVTGVALIGEGRSDADFSLIGWDNNKGGTLKNVLVVSEQAYPANANTAITDEIAGKNYVDVTVVTTAEYIAMAQAAADKAAADAAAAKAAADKALADEKAAAAEAAKKAADELAAVKADLEAAKAEAPAADDKAEEGCKGVIAAGAILVTVSALGLGAVVAKKKED
ncbi:MAG: hypothetical protein E7664_03260 [Ruminococcaceae bacterium]|nr:hypothetical protein [Oscillospiraceae bacterium]